MLRLNLTGWWCQVSFRIWWNLTGCCEKPPTIQINDTRFGNEYTNYYTPRFHICCISNNIVSANFFWPEYFISLVPAIPSIQLERCVIRLHHTLESRLSNPVICWLKIIFCTSWLDNYDYCCLLPGIFIHYTVQF